MLNLLLLINSLLTLVFSSKETEGEVNDWLKFRESVTKDPSISPGHTHIF